MEVRVRRYLDFSLFTTHLKYKVLWSRERRKCWNFKVILCITNKLEGNASFETISEIQQLLLKEFSDLQIILQKTSQMKNN